jgi:porin
MISKTATYGLAIASILMAQTSTSAFEFGVADPAWAEYWFAQKQALADAGLKLDFEWSQAAQGMLVGEGDDGPAYGGKLDLLATLDLTKLGLWDGLSVTGQVMYNYGEFLNGVGGVLTPIYDGAIYPGSEGADRFDVMSLYFTQRFGDRITLNVGKINLMEQARGYPLRGGGGIDAFWNVNLATTITGLAKPAIFGAQLSIATDPVTYGLTVFDARDAMNRNIFEDVPFSKGVTVMATATLKTEIGGHLGYYGIRGIYSNEESFDLRNLSYLNLPEGTPDELNTLGSSWLLSAQFEQYLVGGEGGSTAGWGVFSEFVLVDGNPQPFRWSFQLGLAGNGLIESRPNDRFGIAGFAFAFSDLLKEGLADAGIADIDNEYGLELFYNWEVNEFTRLTADLQIIDPANSDETAVFAGIGTNIRF